MKVYILDDYPTKLYVLINNGVMFLTEIPEYDEYHPNNTDFHSMFELTKKNY